MEPFVVARQTWNPSVIVRDVDAHYARPTATGATLVHEDIADQGHGGRGCYCRDPGRRLGMFGSDAPWAA